MNSQNPLLKYQRQPELYVSLPSKNKWWPENSLTISDNNEYAIYPMTGKDEMALRNPEGLMNGDSTVQILQSCVPNIKNAWDTPVIDVDHLFIAIRIASVGHNMDLDIKCPKCGHESTYTVDLRIILDQIKIPNYNEPIEISDNMFMFIRPASYKIASLNAQEVFQQTKAIKVANNENLSDEQKESILRESVYALTELSVSRLSEYIEKLILPDGQIVNNHEFIKEYVENVDRKTFKKIKQSIESIANEYQMPDIPFKCSECGHEEKFKFQFEPGNFFGADS